MEYFPENTDRFFKKLQNANLKTVEKTVFRLVGGNSYLGESLVTNAFPD